MGWTFFHKPVGLKAVDAIKHEFGDEWVAKHVVAQSATREAVFFVVKRHDPGCKIYVPDADGFTRSIAVIAIKSAPKSQYNFGYKDMTEAMGPYGCEVPLSIVAAASPLRDPIGPPERWSSLQSAHDYRERSRVMAQAKATKRALKPGSLITLREPLNFGGTMLQTFKVGVAHVRGNRGLSNVFRAVDNGMLCGLAARHLIGATIVPPTG